MFLINTKKGSRAKAIWKKKPLAIVMPLELHYTKLLIFSLFMKGIS